MARRILIAISAVVALGCCALIARTPDAPIDLSFLCLSYAQTPEARAQGLSGIPSLAKNEGMLFLFDVPDRYGFWMKDMQMRIDILWLNADDEVVHIVERATPESYPASFYPTHPAYKVLEVQEGFAEMHAIRQGSKLLLPTGWCTQ